MNDLKFAKMNIVLCTAVDPSPLELRAMKELGVDPDVTYEGAEQVQCTDCHRLVWRGPRQKQVMESHPEQEFTVLCQTCLVLRSVQEGFDIPEATINDLGNTKTKKVGET